MLYCNSYCTTWCNIWYDLIRFQTCQNLSKLVETCRNLSKLVETCQNLSKLVETCLNISKHIQICFITASIWKTFLAISTSCPLRKASLKWPRSFLPILQDFILWLRGKLLKICNIWPFLIVASDWLEGKSLYQLTICR